MPGMSGPDLYAALLTRWPTLPAVFVSGNPQGIATTLEGATATRFLQKPFSPTALVNLVAELLSEVRSG